tara:strand:- start:308 stop:439 length:132 start_codon:yes stop_codon:yes gene_type:complete
MQESNRFFGMARSLENRPFVVLQSFEPRRNIGGVIVARLGLDA